MEKILETAYEVVAIEETLKRSNLGKLKELNDRNEFNLMLNLYDLSNRKKRSRIIKKLKNTTNLTLCKVYFNIIQL